jgi:hypothetical protein
MKPLRYVETLTEQAGELCMDRPRQDSGMKPMTILVLLLAYRHLTLPGALCTTTYVSVM